MNSSTMEKDLSMIEIEDDDDDVSTIVDDEPTDTNKQRPGTHMSRASLSSSTTGASASSKRQKDISPCYVCGAKAHGYNFDQITCESCKAFFRRNALKSMDRFRCRNNDNCVITPTTRKRCKRCRLSKCFKVGMRKEWILTEEEKRLKRKKIERNRLLKQQQAHLAIHHSSQNNVDLMHSTYASNLPLMTSNEQIPSTTSSSNQVSRKSSDSSILPLPSMCMYRPSDQQLYTRHHGLLKQLTEGYYRIAQQNPQPNKFIYRKSLISQTTDMDSKLYLIKDLTRELTQMTTSRLLHYFTLIPEFQELSEGEKKAILIKNMLTVFMFHGALTYNADNDTFVDRTTADEPYDAKYLLLVYGSRVYNNFRALSLGLTSVTYQSPSDKQSDERAHMVFLLLMVILLFSDGFDPTFELISNEIQPSIDHQSNRSNLNRSLSTTSDSTSSISSTASSSSSSSTTASNLNEKLHRIQQNYIELACRYLHDEFGLSIGRRMFKDLVPLLLDLQKLCSTLANVNLCELAEEEDRSSSSRSLTHSSREIESRSTTHSSPATTFNSAMISGRSHLNELQKENREPPVFTSHSNPSPLSSSNRSSYSSNTSISSPESPSFLADTITTLENYRLA